MSITFDVDRVKAAAPSLRATAIIQDLTASKIDNGAIESFQFTALEGEFRKPDRNSFLETCLMAYAKHVPLVLSPDDVWIVICQAVSKHIEVYPEETRKSLLGFEGKKTLEVYADDFIRGQLSNKWERVFDDFATEIGRFLGDKKDLFNPCFTTTTAIPKAVIQVQMMSGLAPYFDYVVWTRCGIPSVTLLGTTADWSSIRGRVISFEEFYPDWALVPLIRFATEAEQASRGRPDRAYWSEFVKAINGSGGCHINGHINALFPYLDGRKNTSIGGPNPRLQGSNLGTFPGSVSSVPVLWKYLGTDYKMRLASGVFGTYVDTLTYQTGAYRPILGWVLGEERES